MKKIATVIVALATGFTGIAPAHAFPGILAISTPQATMPDVEQVRDRRWIRRGHDRYSWNRRDWDRRGWDRRGWRGDYRRGHYRHWRYDNDYYHNNYAGAIIGGLAAGAILGGVLNAPRRYYYAGNSHTSWCYNRYRSYRASDNTYQPYYGARRQCVSPY